jgi:putative drug exporter of the RND superfamily
MAAMNSGLRTACTQNSACSATNSAFRSATVISCAALIMTSVFFSFLLSSSVVIKMLALGLGASILIDASVIRLLIVPATMFLLGRYDWWTPRWLDRILPHLDPEGGMVSPMPGIRSITNERSRPVRVHGR